MLPDTREIIVKDLEKIAGARLGTAVAHVTFDYRHPGVVLPDFLKNRFRARGAEVMMITLENAYWRLRDHGDVFAVELKFDGNIFGCCIPYDAIRAWNCVNTGEPIPGYRSEEFYKMRDRLIDSLNGTDTQTDLPPAPNVVSLDAFRRKR